MASGAVSPPVGGALTSWGYGRRETLTGRHLMPATIAPPHDSTSKRLMRRALMVSMRLVVADRSALRPVDLGPRRWPRRS